MSWIDESGPYDDFIISSRIRYARNLSDMDFPSTMTEKDAESLIYRVQGSLIQEDSSLKDIFQLLTMEDLSQNEKNVLVERHLASPDLIEEGRKSALLINKEETLSLMVNEEDHLRIQSLLPGLRLRENLEMVDKVDDALDESLPYAFDDTLGYLTTCPTNIGTGMRASVMIHLAALTVTGQMKHVIQTLAKIGLAVRGIYGEGSELIGDMYQISNQVTLGASEEELIENLELIANQLVAKEKQAREVLRNRITVLFDDNIWRAYGLLKNARVLDYKEFMNLLSRVRVGVEMKIIEGIDMLALNHLMIYSQDGHLNKYYKKESTDDFRVLRANLVRERFG